MDTLCSVASWWQWQSMMCFVDRFILCEAQHEVYQSLDDYGDADADCSLAAESAELRQKRQDWLSQIDFNKYARYRHLEQFILNVIVCIECSRVSKNLLCEKLAACQRHLAHCARQWRQRPGFWWIWFCLLNFFFAFHLAAGFELEVCAGMEF